MAYRTVSVMLFHICVAVSIRFDATPIRSQVMGDQAAYGVSTTAGQPDPRPLPLTPLPEDSACLQGAHAHMIDVAYREWFVPDLQGLASDIIALL